MKCTQGTSAELHELVGTRPDSDFIIKTLQEQDKERAGRLRLQPSRGDKSSQSDKVWRKREGVWRKRKGVWRKSAFCGEKVESVAKK